MKRIRDIPNLHYPNNPSEHAANTLRRKYCYGGSYGIDIPVIPSVTCAGLNQFLKDIAPDDPQTEGPSQVGPSSREF